MHEFLFLQGAGLFPAAVETDIPGRCTSFQGKEFSGFQTYLEQSQKLAAVSAQVDISAGFPYA
ncbi:MULTISPECIES: hypothetical protein [Akkermansia]|uniref:hypothetical protein n=1 Tax=Akkermansia TaxID=239934 RepID=UPI0004F36BFD|nr:MULTISPECIES: hypothetical protein [Akkermansia]MDR3920830.1 hypothetical protein [Akkermansia sp.]PND14502.1 hypothetical protein CXT84_00325 [Akkermansia muciniphila]